MTPVSWVVGAGGLLGSAVTRRLRAAGVPIAAARRIEWTSPPAAAADLAAGLADLIAAAAGGPWHVYWCAGGAVTGSSEQAFMAEIALFETFLDSMRALPVDTRRNGVLFVASSAGGAYGGASGAPFDEESETMPLGHYGRAKLAMEDATRAFAETSGVRSLVGRIANLYGPGQNVTKPQGLISHLCLASLQRRPLAVYVSLDTLRDYVYVDDAADIVVAASGRLRQTTDAPFHLKVIASGRSVSIGALLGEFGQVAGRRPEIIMAASPQSALQGLDLRLRSRHWRELDARASTNLADGIARTLQDARSGFLRSGRQG